MDKSISTIQLLVPVDRELRIAIQNKSREIVFRRKIQPPADIELIEELAGQVMAETGIDRSYFEFTMVNCGNEIWRSVVEAIPFNRRLLLLPQCLRDSENCQAVFDELGLLCAGCNHCNLSGLLEMAGSLGYTTLVAEGTTVAVSLVEEGAIDAVIGVCCMETLQKSFNPVSASGVPVMGIPLLHNGCVDTQVDLKWLRHELTSHRCNSSLQPVSLSLLKDRIERLFTKERLSDYFTDESPTTLLAMESILQGGHRIRPLLVMLAYEAYSHDPDQQTSEELAFAVECFHKASLIHDDIEDSDDFRYQKETLHKKEGVSVAINIGDLLVGKGYKALAGLNLEPIKRVQIIKTVSDSHVDSATGQGFDLLQTRDNEILTVEKQLDVFRLKTGSAIKASLLQGAIAAGVSLQELEHITSFADNFGLAYQIQDDLHEYQQKEGALNPFDFPFLMSLLKQYTHRFSNENIEENMTRFEIEKEAKQYLDDYLFKAYQSVANISGLKLRLGLHMIMGSYFKR